MISDKIRIAIDGPSGAGKSTIAKAVAKALGIDYIDTGAMYRALGYKLIRENMTADECNKRFTEMLDNTEIDFSDGRILLDGEDVSSFIRTPEISKAASSVSALGSVRKRLVSMQQKMASDKSVVMDGRDIAEVVMPDAEFKFFMTASAEERAERRYKELLQKNGDISYESVLADILKRDENDSTRDISPLRKADDAVLLDTTGMSIEEVVSYILKEVTK